ncbi:MAG: 6,7-dimethyl-8-ribityllumazine synthase [Candidatus Fermentibacteria bacterium]|nr:6,7-dimethyl-8-ribityllumazine synthase [Candidatus Fermentibacteria bacterium]
MAWIHEGQLEGEGLKTAIVVSRFNSLITGRLLDGAQDCLIRHGVEEEDIDVFWVPGAWEIPAVAANLAKSRSFDAVICLGTIIRGETPHFEYVASENAKGIAQAGMNSSVPVVYGMITADTVDQAVDRAGTKSGNKGFDAAMTALEMASLYEQINGFTASSPSLESPEE